MRTHTYIDRHNPIADGMDEALDFNSVYLLDVSSLKSSIDSGREEIVCAQINIPKMKCVFVCCVFCFMIGQYRLSVKSVVGLFNHIAMPIKCSVFLWFIGFNEHTKFESKRHDHYIIKILPTFVFFSDKIDDNKTKTDTRMRSGCDSKDA